MRWQYKCFVDNCKALVPMQDRLRAIKHRLVGYEPDPPERIAYTIAEGLKQIDWIRSVRPLESLTALEIGTGWQPLIPILFSLSGVKHVLLVDQYRLCGPVTFRLALDAIRENLGRIGDALGRDRRMLERSLPGSGSFEECLAALRMTYLAPCDSQSLPLPAESVDVITSRAVLEHVPPPVIRGIFSESFRLLKPDGVVCHFVDNADHWEFLDKSITRVNFLKFSDAVFRLTCLNSQHYQNRLRHSEYVALLHAAGFSMVRDERQVDERSLQALKSMPVNERFHRFDKADLATIGSYLFAQKQPGAAFSLAAAARVQ